MNQVTELLGAILLLPVVFRPEVVWLLVLQLLKTEDAYALCRVTFGSRFQSPSLGFTDVREANIMAYNINSLSSILLSIHYHLLNSGHPQIDAAFFWT